MLYAIIAIDKQGALALRLANRDAHFAYVRETGLVKLGGPFLDGAGNMQGSLLILDAGSLDEARAWAANDPYAKAGLFASSEVRPWKATVNPIEARL